MRVGRGRQVAILDLMRARAAGALLVLSLFALSACGGSSSTSTTSSVAGKDNHADLTVIDGWVTALRQGNFYAASYYFNDTATAENGPILTHIRTLDDAR